MGLGFGLMGSHGMMGLIMATSELSILNENSIIVALQTVVSRCDQQAGRSEADPSDHPPPVTPKGCRTLRSNLADSGR